MSNFNYALSSVTDCDFNWVNEYDIITGNDYPDIKEVGAANDVNGCRVISLDQFTKELETLFSKNLNIDELKKKAIAGALKSSYFRSICWRCLLGILHSEPKQWLLELTTYRNHYRDLWVELEKNPWNVERSPSDNPLSQEKESIWQKYFCNEELKSVIHQDVVRTFPGVAFFKQETIQNLMVRILFCYARQNPALSYRQGMHEILAPIIYVLHYDYQALQHFKNQNISNTDIFEILNPVYAEEDAYSIFKHIMNHIECCYRIKNMESTATGYFPSQVNGKNCENEVVTRLQYIKNNILQTSDPDLNKHLDKLDIPLQLFGIRWLRLLFGREFPFQDLLVLWDALFAVNNLELVDYVVVAMLTAVRAIILNGDYMSCLSNLMHYPSGVDVMFVIEYSLHLMDPTEYAVPTITSIGNKRISLFPKPKGNIKKKNHEASNCDSSAGNEERLKSSKPSQWLSVKYHPLTLPGGGDGDGSIIEGFALDDPKILKSELERMSITIGVVHAKLKQYHSLLSQNLSEPLNPNVKQALEGIHELRSLLETYQCQVTNSNVEEALEAGETKQSTSAKKKTNEMKNPLMSAFVDNTKFNTLPNSAKKESVRELRLFKKNQVVEITGAPMTDPLRSMRISLCNDDNEEILNPDT